MYGIIKHTSAGRRILVESGTSLDLLQGAMEHRWTVEGNPDVVKYSLEGTDGSIYSELEF